MQQQTIEIDQKYNGPNVSANGGYTCGTMAAKLEKGRAHSMRLMAPPPLNQPLTLAWDDSSDSGSCNGGNSVELLLDGKAIGEGRVVDADLTNLPRPVCPDDDAVRAAAENAYDSSFDFLRHCYVCGPDRKECGMHIHPGPLADDDSQVACFWQTKDHHRDVNSPQGYVDEREIWSALDCPGYFACAQGEPALLGSMTGQIINPVKAGTRVKIHAWTISVSGRKHRSGVALYAPAPNSGDTDQLIALADQTWVVVKQEMFDSLRG